MIRYSLATRTPVLPNLPVAGDWTRLHVFCDADGKSHVFKGLVEGRIADRPRGKNGFGWDQIFIPDGESKTFGEMTDDQKNKYSMRARALEKFKKLLGSAKI